MDAYIIIGEAKQRKSSTIRALTGVWRKDIFKLATNGNILDTYIQVQSLQEAGLTPQQFISEVNNNQCNAVLTSLRTRAVTGGNFPHCIKYIQEFQNAGWNIKGIAVLGATSLNYNLPLGIQNPIYIPSSDPTNKIASIIRTQWKWL